jgi:hypothetical protein
MSLFLLFLLLLSFFPYNVFHLLNKVSAGIFRLFDTDSARPELAAQSISYKIRSEKKFHIYCSRIKKTCLLTEHILPQSTTGFCHYLVARELVSFKHHVMSSTLQCGINQISNTNVVLLLFSRSSAQSTISIPVAPCNRASCHVTSGSMTDPRRSIGSEATIGTGHLSKSRWTCARCRSKKIKCTSTRVAYFGISVH